MSMPRLFIGIGLPQSYQKALTPFVAAISHGMRSKVRWVKPNNWHLTLKFLGATDEAEVPVIESALSTLQHHSFPIKAGGHGAFPNLRRPRTLWVGLKQGIEECSALAGKIEDVLANVGFEKEDKEFRPHLTIGRVKKPGRDDWKTILAKTERDWPIFTVDRFTLWESDLRPTGAIHVVRREFPLQDT